MILQSILKGAVDSDEKAMMRLSRNLEIIKRQIFMNNDK